MPGGLKGKVGYMAPEQARGEPLDARADVFALGAVLFEMLTAQNPFSHDSPRENEALERRAAGRVFVRCGRWRRRCRRGSRRS